MASILPFIRKAGAVFDDRVTQIMGEAFDSACALSLSAEVRLWICPTAEISVWTVLALFCNSVSGCDSTAISDEMMLFTSSPLPMPAELMEPVVVLEVVVMDFLAVGSRFARAALPNGV